MKISYNWLNDYIKTDLSVEKVASVLTDIGLEVEGVDKVESAKSNFNGVVVGEVIDCIKHPNADKLKITQVKINENEILQIVCGATNVDIGQKVPVATIGTILYDKEGKEFKIKKSKIRGEDSFGMICSEEELGIGENHEGIMVLDSHIKLGMPIKEILTTSSDYTLEIGLTPNRTDAMSHFGVARDLASALKSRKVKSELLPISIEEFKLDEENTNPVQVEIEDANLCPRYSGIYLKDVEVKPSPEWLQKKLRTIGLTPINNAVDITNYILHSYGQPLHAFDADKIKGNKLKVGSVQKGTKFVTLDNVERNLDGTELVIKDSEDQPLCLAGIYGGLESGVSSTTKNIFLESAYFNPISIRKTSKKEGISTDSSFRFERGVDPNNTLLPLKKAAELFKELANATLVGEIIDEYPQPIKEVNTVLRYHKIDQILGKRIHRDQIKEIVKSLDFTIISDVNDVLDLNVPTYRVDVTREIDVIEEVARIYGYNHIDIPEKFSFTYDNNQQNEEDLLEDSITNLLKFNGFYEVLNNSITTKKMEDTNYVELLNPLSSDLSVMRQTLLYGMLQTVSFNYNRNQKEIKLFELGKVYFKTSGNNYLENKKLGLILSGNFQSNNWISKENRSSFFHLKGIVYQLLNSLGIQPSEKPIHSNLYDEGIELSMNNTYLGEISIISPSQLKEFGIKNEVYFAELDWDNILDLSTKRKALKFEEISKFPGSSRDLALLVDKNVNYFDLYKTAFNEEKILIKSINLFDVYEGEKLPVGKKSYALNFIIQDERKTLTDSEIDAVMNNLINIYSREFKAELRN
ncbi:phenylalanine--tRNA ligase subunit beta [Apibacter muscae]|uniref:phenylalanine--tRNA ligase subunit beta n=1 Tax=Apibacter muscae TaxID=2509004 RepID=UPI0011AC571D|nr:phenylalanine--tRNA ligase subunit beta [Apibacter muscae]TWP23815.1 phenylalanine--tRNA ligase subunit beta [Apibacter muscae]